MSRRKHDEKNEAGMTSHYVVSLSIGKSFSSLDRHRFAQQKVLDPLCFKSWGIVMLKF